MMPTVMTAPETVFNFSPLWTRQPSIALCAVECGAKCCKGPGYFRMTDEEATRLRKKKKDLRMVAQGSMWLVRWEQGEQCAFLGPNNACTIYDERPRACRCFPSKPHKGCLVWPAKGESDGMESQQQ